ncbi:ParA family protein [Methyloligella halotolerans]|nr:ParA family protein [Methyloligella halotolerans]
MKSRTRPDSTQRVITFASSKGGVGKSTFCAAIAGALASREGRVAILDLDQNQTLYRWHRQHGGLLTGITVLEAVPDSFNQSLASAKESGADIILIDVAGAYEATMIKAIAASDLVVTPAKLSEPDLREAAKLLSEVNAFNQRFGSSIRHRLLVNEADCLNPLYQRHALAELDGSALKRFAHLMMRRAPYREIFISGMPPHLADKGRGPVKKAIAELDTIVDEVLQVLSQPTKARAA